MNPRTVLAIARKDIHDAIRNRYLLMSLVLPIGLSVLFQVIFGQITNTGVFRVAVYDPDASRLTAQLREESDIKIVEVESEDRLRQEVEGDAVGGILIPADFDRNVDLGGRPELTVYLNGRKNGGELAVFRQIVLEQVWAMREGSEPTALVWSLISPQPQAASEVGFRKEGFRMDTYLLVMFLIMSLTMTGSLVVPLLMVEEKEKHTMEFLLVSPVTPAEIAAGKAVTGLAYSTLSVTILVALNRGWAGDWPVTFLAVAAGALFLVMVGLLMGTMMHTMMQVNTWSTVVMMLLLAPSWLTVLELPAPLSAAIRIIPTYYLVDILNRSLAGQIVAGDVALRLAFLAACTLATFGIVVWAIRRQEA
jgi:ABC-2 type transport system permease protein